MFAKFGEAFRLLGSNLFLFSAIVLTVWLPASLFTNYLTFYVPSPDDVLRSIRINWFIQVVFDPISAGALIYAFSKRKAGERPGYFESISVGFRKWGRLLIVQLLTGILIGVGFIAFFIPGIMMMVRYALIDSVVVLEGGGADKARRRSTELTRGVRWQIFWAGLLFFAVFVPLAFLIYIPLDYFEELYTMATGVALDCAVCIAYTPIQIVLFLYYWQAVMRERENAKPPADDVSSPVDARTPAVPYREGEAQSEPISALRFEARLTSSGIRAAIPAL
jgi:hypothetical protein